MAGSVENDLWVWRRDKRVRSGREGMKEEGVKEGRR